LRHFRKILAQFCGGFLLVAPFAAAQTPETHQVTDMLGRTVTVPVHIDRIAEQFPAHTVTDVMLGAGDKIVAIPTNVKTIPLLQKIYPRITAIPDLFRNGGAVNIEDVLSLHPDVVSALDGGATVAPFGSAGLTAVVMSFSRLPDLAPSITLAGQLYGGAAQDRARAFVTYFNGKVAMIQQRLADLPEAQRPSVVHISSFPPPRDRWWPFLDRRLDPPWRRHGCGA
jgi:iron complex transport system substrate-binding protein